MATSTETMRMLDEQIKISDEAICRQIESVDFHGRGVVSQTVLKLLRDFVEHIMFKIYSGEHDVEYHYDNIKDAISFVKTKGQLKFLWKFHAYLQIVASHYTLDPENSERVMIKYYEYLLKIKDFIKAQYSADVLENLGKFPLNTDKNMQEYYEKIAAKLSNRNARADLSSSISGRYYVHKVKPFFVNQRVYGILWLSNMIDKNRNLLSEELEVNTIYYIESIVRKYILTSRHKIRTTLQTKKAVVSILSFLVERGSATGYLLRENIL